MPVASRAPARPVALPARAWAWLLVALVLLKAAVPLVATVAAARQGVALAEVCSVYGVRLVAADMGTSHPEPSPGSTHADEEHCVLGSLLGGAAPAASLAAQLLAPVGRHTVAAMPQRPLPRDASRLWLMARLHAPPVRA